MGQALLSATACLPTTQLYQKHEFFYGGGKVGGTPHSNIKPNSRTTLNALDRETGDLDNGPNGYRV